MRSSALLLTAFFTYYNAASSTSIVPFENVSPRDSDPESLFFQKRQNACANGQIQCTAINSAVCCPSTAVCTRDPSGNAACCPSGYVCTGNINGSPATATATGTGSTTPFVLGQTTTATASAEPTTAAPESIPAGYSTVPNAYYPFILIPTSYSNSQACLTAFTLCSSASQACFNSLAGQNGVTVSGVGSQGLTQAGASGTVASGASSICSSLSLRGCYNLQSSQCNSFGSAGATGTAGLVQSGAAAVPAMARCTGALYTAAAAVAGVGLVRMAGASM